MLNSHTADLFIEAQVAGWPLASGNYGALDNVLTREFRVGGMCVKVQCNPARIASTAAKVDKASIAERPCFLCRENRPAQQGAMEWGEGYEILLNPMPIFRRHLTVADRSHKPQSMGRRSRHMMDLARVLDDYVVFYNGPRCGASAPDHQHFQAGCRGLLTLPDAVENSRGKVIARDGDATLTLVDELPMALFVIVASDHEAGERLFERLFSALPVPDGHYEPMVNVLCYTHPEGERLVVIPRKRHRPSFYGDGPGQMLVSPASVDLAGVFITPRREDFEKFDADTALKIYSELCLTPEEARGVAEKI